MKHKTSSIPIKSSGMFQHFSFNNMAERVRVWCVCVW